MLIFLAGETHWATVLVRPIGCVVAMQGQRKASTQRWCWYSYSIQPRELVVKRDERGIRAALSGVGYAGCLRSIHANDSRGFPPLVRMPRSGQVIAE